MTLFTNNIHALQFKLQARHSSIPEFGQPISMTSREIEAEHPLACKILRQRPDIQAVTITLQSGDIRLSRARSEEAQEIESQVMQAQRDWEGMPSPYR